MFEPTAGRLQPDINSLLVNIYIHTDSYVGNEGIYIVVRPYGRMHTILVIHCFSLLYLCPQCDEVFMTLWYPCWIQHSFPQDPQNDKEKKLIKKIHTL